MAHVFTVGTNKGGPCLPYRADEQIDKIHAVCANAISTDILHQSPEGAVEFDALLVVSQVAWDIVQAVVVTIVSTLALDYIKRKSDDVRRDKLKQYEEDASSLHHLLSSDRIRGNLVKGIQKALEPLGGNEEQAYSLVQRVIDALKEWKE